MRFLLPLTAALLGVSLASADAETTSAYSGLIAERDCTIFSAAAEGDGDWANLVCGGYRGYPVFIYYSDAREALFYGFPPAGDQAPAWESFEAFNSSGPKIEWRLDDSSGNPVPFATIHRWSVSIQDEAERRVEVLVVEKVGQPHERVGCAVGYIVASGNQQANEKARRIADEKARKFRCGTDSPVLDVGAIPLPSFHRIEP